MHGASAGSRLGRHERHRAQPPTPTTEHAFLDDNGTWQSGSGDGSGSSAGSGSFTASGSQDWSLSGGSGYQTTIYGNWASGTRSVGGSGRDSYHYTAYYSFCPGGQWLATGPSQTQQFPRET